MHTQHALDVVGGEGAKIQFTSARPTSHELSLTADLGGGDLPHMQTFHELPYTFAEYEREAPLATEGELADAMKAIAKSKGYTTVEILAYWLVLTKTLCGMEGVTLEEVAKRSLTQDQPGAEVSGGSPRVS